MTGQCRIALLCLAILVGTGPGAALAQGGRTADSDNTFDTATAVGGKGSLAQTLDIANDGSDFYKLTAPSGDIISVSIFTVDWVSTAPDLVNFSLYLYGKDQVQIAASASRYQYEAVAALAVANGTYYIEVRTISGAGGYTLDWSVGAAQVVRNGDSIHGYLADSLNHNSDWYRVQLNGGASADIFTAQAHTGATPDIDLYFMDLWSEYSFWYDVSWWSDPDEHVEAQATYTGWYYLQVSDFSGKGNYTLNITVTPGTGDADSEPAGARPVPYNSSFYSSVDMAHDHYDWYRFTLGHGETLIAEMRLDPAPHDMFAMSILGADMSTMASTTNFDSGGPPALNRTITLQEVAPADGTYYIVVLAKVGLLDTIVDLSDANAKGDYTLTVGFSAHPPAPKNHAPVPLGPRIDVAFDANSNYTLDVTGLFTDPDNDTLHYSALGNGSIGVDFGASGNATLAPASYWYGTDNFTINATDPGGLGASVYVNATVRKVPFLPVIDGRTPADTNVTGVNGTALSFLVSAHDPNHQGLSYRWLVNGADQGVNANVFSWKVPGPSGAFAVQAAVSNADGALSVSWNVTATAKPAIRVSIVTPFNHTAVKEGDRITFYAVAPDIAPADLINISFMWYLGTARLSELAQFSTTSLPAGEDNVTVVVTGINDTSESGRTSITVYVEKKEQRADYTAAFIVAALLLAAAGAIGFTLYSRRGGRPGRPVPVPGDGDMRRSKKKTARSKERARARKR